MLALPRGGVPVAFEVANALHLPLDVFVVRKLGAPGQPELAMGAIATGGVRVLNRDVVETLGITSADIELTAASELEELRRRETLYRGARPALDVAGMTAILIDDGLATGASMRAAVLALRRREPAQIVVAVPVAAADTCDRFIAEKLADELVCPMIPPFFQSVGQWYEQFEQASDDEVRELLWQTWRSPTNEGEGFVQMNG